MPKLEDQEKSEEIEAGRELDFRKRMEIILTVIALIVLCIAVVFLMEQIYRAVHYGW